MQITEEFTQKPKVEKVSKPKAKEPVKKPVKEPIKTTPKPKNVTKTFPHGTYFIQVGSFSQVPSSRFLSVIQKSGFQYGISRANAQGIKKLLIGPYSSRASVDAALPRVRDRINKKAFVVKK
ncbi:MAG: SPOR domain-containing protein [Sulfurovum sp.]|nr:SPOR domain-containing protein [Sulfurovum sp.]